MGSEWNINVRRAKMWKQNFGDLVTEYATTHIDWRRSELGIGRSHCLLPIAVKYDQMITRRWAEAERQGRSVRINRNEVMVMMWNMSVRAGWGTEKGNVCEKRSEMNCDWIEGTESHRLLRWWLLSLWWRNETVDHGLMSEANEVLKRNNKIH